MFAGRSACALSLSLSRAPRSSDAHAPRPTPQLNTNKNHSDSEGEVRIWDLQQRRALFSRVLHDAQAGVLHLAVVGALGEGGGPALLR
jgi:hypothetical protein